MNSDQDKLTRENASLGNELTEAKGQIKELILQLQM